MAAAVPTLPPRMSLDEKAMVRRMHFQRKMMPAQIAAATGRDLSTIVRNLQPRKKTKKLGRPRVLSEDKINRVEKTLKDLVAKKGIQAKIDSGIQVFAIPKRSPDLNVCDYALWKQVIRQMRAQEAKWSKSKRETRDEYLGRLRRTALSLPRQFVMDAVGDMKRRCQRLFAAKGGLFEEGGRGK